MLTTSRTRNGSFITYSGWAAGQVREKRLKGQLKKDGPGCAAYGIVRHRTTGDMRGDLSKRADCRSLIDLHSLLAVERVASMRDVSFFCRRESFEEDGAKGEKRVCKSL